MKGFRQGFSKIRRILVKEAIPIPELPEVETLRRSLLPYIPSPVVQSVEVLHPSVIQPSNEIEFKRNLIGKQITEAKRRGKYLVLVLSPTGSLVIHLRMTGQFFYRPPQERTQPKIAHTHLIMNFVDGSAFHYADVRRFGRICYHDSEILDPGYCALGPEPFDSSFTVDYLKILGSRKAPIKSLLLQQNLIAGLGNIYADEALFRARIHPLRSANTLSEYEWGALHHSICSVIHEAVESRGSSLRDYLDANREKGSYQDQWSVYQQTGKPCIHCGTLIERVKVAGRSSHYCPSCQTLKTAIQPQVIGITGGIASGKSTVVSFLQDLGATIVDADAISRSLTVNNGPAVSTILHTFGEEFASSPGVLNRKKLGELIFSDATARQKLNSILHPLILDEMQKEIDAYHANPTSVPLFLDIPLLFEEGLEFFCDQIWLVYVDPSTQLQRLKVRDSLTEEQALKRIHAQMPMEEKRSKSNHIIDNSGSLDDTKKQIEHLWEIYGFPNKEKE